MSPTRPFLILGLGLLAVSTGALFVRFAQSDGVPSLAIAAVRLTLSTLILLPVALQRHRADFAALPPRVWLLVLLSGVFLGLHFATWISSLEYTSIANSTVLVSSSPLFVALIAWIILREPPGRTVWAGLLIAIAGSVVIALSDVCSLEAGCAASGSIGDGSSLVGDALALIGAAAVAVYLVIGRRLRQGLALVPYITLTYGAAAVSLLTACLVTSTPLIGYDSIAYLWLLLLALLPQLVGHTSFNWALKHLPATFVSVATLGEPILSSALAMLVIGEAPTLLKIVGGLIVLVGIGTATQAAGGRAQVSGVRPQASGPSEGPASRGSNSDA